MPFLLNIINCDLKKPQHYLEKSFALDQAMQAKSTQKYLKGKKKKKQNKLCCPNFVRRRGFITIPCVSATYTARSFNGMWRGGRREWIRVGGGFLCGFFKRTKVILLLVAPLLQYLSALEVNKGCEGGLGWFGLGRLSPLLVPTRSDPRREKALLSPPAPRQNRDREGKREKESGLPLSLSRLL